MEQTGEIKYQVEYQYENEDNAIPVVSERKASAEVIRRLDGLPAGLPGFLLTLMRRKRNQYGTKMLLSTGFCSSLCQ